MNNPGFNEESLTAKQWEALWGLYYSMYYLPRGECLALFESLPDSVIKAYARVQGVANDE